MTAAVTVAVATYRHDDYLV